MSFRIFASSLIAASLWACGPAAKPKAFATDVGTPVGAPATATIGAAGGSLSSPDSRLQVTIPAGALTADTAIAIQPITDRAPGGRGNAYRLTPDGQSFAKPVSFAFQYGEPDLANTAVEALGAAWQSSDGLWHWVPSPAVDASAKTVTVTADHFTDYAPVTAFGLRPASPMVDTGKTLKVTGFYCYLGVSAAPGDKDLGDLPGIDCGAGLNPNDLEPVVGPITDWTVDGVAGGTPASGTVSGTSLTATYTAPTTRPSAAVTLGGKMRYGGAGSVEVHSRLGVGFGMGRYAATVSASGTWVYSYTTYTVAASVSVTLVLGDANDHGAAYPGVTTAAAISSAKFSDFTRDCTFKTLSGEGGMGLNVHFDAQTWEAIGVIRGTGTAGCVVRATGLPDPDTTEYFEVQLGTCTPLPTYQDLGHFGGACDFHYPSWNTGSTVHLTYDFVGSF